MTVVREIAGLPTGRRNAPDSSTAQGIRLEMNQRGALVKPLPFIDTANLSEGEMMVLLKGLRYKIYSEYFPEDPVLRRGWDMAQNALARGLHRDGASITGVIDPQLDEIAHAITHGQAWTKPASGFFSSWDEKERTPMRGIGDPTIPQVNCEQKYPIMSEANWNAGGKNGFSQFTHYFQYQQWQYDNRGKCAEENKWRKWLNDYWIKQSHMIMYKFVPNLNTVPNQVSYKGNQHKAFHAFIRENSKISDALLTEWLRTGVVFNNTKGANGQSIGPVEPEELIENFKEAGETGIGGFIPLPVLIPIAIAVVAICVGQAKIALGVLKGNMSPSEAVKQQLTTAINFFKEYGSDLVAPQPADFSTESGGGGQQGAGNQPPTGNQSGGFKLGTTELLLGAGVLAAVALSSGDGKKRR